MKLPLLLALLFGAVSALHLRLKLPTLRAPWTLPQDGEMPEQGAEEPPPGEMALLEREEEGRCGSEDSLEEEGTVQSASALDVVDKDFQCPKEEDTIKLEGSPGCKTCRFLVVTAARNFNHAQSICQRCYRGNLASIHNYGFNLQIQCTARSFNQGQVWIGGVATGWGICTRLHWVDRSCWNFAYWALGQPSIFSGRCVSMYTSGGQWSLSNCNACLPFVCSY
uniref:Proteoglycan 2, pro eosinophil major basic protein n=1 Tax=Prolemur simus TaxID=1328070 RepID=A0A8C8YY46_PROSS